MFLLWCFSPDVPGPPLNLKVKEVTKKGCVLSWDPPKSDGGAPILGYVLEKLSSYSSKWQAVSKDVLPSTTFKVRDVSEGDEMEFRVSANNEAGTGPASEPCGVVIKDPFSKLSLLN